MKHPARFALSAALAGFAWGYARHRRSERASLLAALQALEWFVACGGATALLDVIRDRLEPDDIEVERITHTRRTTFEG